MDDAMGAHDDAESVLRKFDREWSAGQKPQIDVYLDRFAELRSEIIAELVLVDFEYRLASDDNIGAELYFDRYPELRADATTAVELVYQEMKLRQVDERNQQDYLRRFPDLADELKEKFGEIKRTTKDHQELINQIQNLLPQRKELAIDAHEFKPGDLLAGRFEIVEEVGRGGFGVVYRARDTQLNRNVAIKISRRLVAEPAVTTQRLLCEARHVANLKHRSIVPVLDVAEHGESLCLVSEFIEGQTLAQSSPLGKSNYVEIARTLSEVAYALHFAHERGVIHRDVKPSNIIVDESGCPHITDFGLAVGKDDASLFEKSGAISGTPAYLSPEQAMGDPNIDGGTDVFSLGIVMYQLLTGELPFQGDRETTIHQVVHVEPVPVRQRSKAIPVDLATICMKALAKQRSQRIPSAKALADELGRFVRGEEIECRRSHPLVRLFRKCCRKPVHSVAVLTAIAALISVGVFLTQKSWQDQNDRLTRLEAGRIARQSVDELFRTLEAEYGRSDEANSVREQLALDAENYYRQIVALRPDDPVAQSMLADAMYRVGVVNFQMNSHLDAARQLARARQQWEQVFEKNPTETEFQYRLVKACDKLGMAQQRVRDFDQALASMNIAERLGNDLVRRFPQNPHYRERLAEVYHHLKGLRDATNQPEEKRKALLSAYSHMEHLVQVAPDNPTFQRRLAEFCMELSTCRDERIVDRLRVPPVEKIDWNLEKLEQAKTIQEQLVDAGQELPWVAIDLSNTLNRIAIVKFCAGDLDGFRSLNDRACAILEKTSTLRADVERLNWDLGCALTQYGKFEMSLSEYEIARRHLDKATRRLQMFISRHETSPDAQLQLAACQILAGRCCDSLQEHRHAAVHYRAAADALSLAKRLEFSAEFYRDDFQKLDAALAKYVRRAP